MKTILELSTTKALEYFMQSAHYCTTPFPKYIDFQKILDSVKNSVGSNDFSNCLKDSKTLPSEYYGVNYSFLMNKDGRYAYRPIQIANPFLYYFLAREITRASNWKFIKNRFKEFKNPKCDVVSIPLVTKPKDKNLTAISVNSWWEHIEQKSIELSLEYKYIFITDITNCYSSIYTHSISWALHGIQYAKEHRNEKNIGKCIDTYLMGMQYGQTSGIPQGSVLFDFISEMILGYSDLLLYEELQKEGIEDYKILRYRDDYRIFSNNKEELEIIIVKFQSVLTVLNFQLNSSKTKLSENVVEDSIKADKLFYIANIPIYKNDISLFATFQKELLYILQFSKKHPNSGTLATLMNNLLKRLESAKDFSEDPNVLSAIIAEISIGSPKIYSTAISMISRLIDKLKTTSEKERIAQSIYRKFSRLPNIGYLQLWMQRITYEMTSQMEFTEPLCRIVNNEANVILWNNEWLKNEFTENLPIYSICTDWIKNEYTPIIDIGETSIFDY